MSRNLIDRDVLLEKAKQEQRFYKDEYDAMESGYLDEERKIVKEAYSTMTDCVSLINNAPTVDAVEVNHGEWLEKKVFDDKIEQWQSCRCSCCGRYNTSPYLYYFSEPQYCSYCGAKMDGEGK